MSTGTQPDWRRGRVVATDPVAQETRRITIPVGTTDVRFEGVTMVACPADEVKPLSNRRRRN